MKLIWILPVSRKGLASSQGEQVNGRLFVDKTEHSLNFSRPELSGRLFLLGDGLVLIASQSRFIDQTRVSTRKQCYEAVINHAKLPQYKTSDCPAHFATKYVNF